MKRIILFNLLFIIALSISANSQPEVDYNNESKSESRYNELTQKESKIINSKGTEWAFSGKFDKHYEDGIYKCKQCGSDLFDSSSKFDSGTGWPSFDDAIPGAVTRLPDGNRTEIVCSVCGAHLGHVFEGEGFTAKNERNCVNSLSLIFKPESEDPDIDKAYFAGGCFWGVEALFDQVEGVIATTSGFMGGHKENPTYREVISGKTGHLETVEITYDKTKVDYETLAKYFFEIHDPQQTNGQGPDIGSQYLSAIFTSSKLEVDTAYKLIDILEAKNYRIATKVLPLNDFWPAEDYHQDYYDKTGKTPYCHFYTKRF